MKPDRSLWPRACFLAGGVCLAALLAAPLLLAQADQPSASVTLNRIRADGRMRLGYRTDAPPFAFRTDSGQPDGYSVALCQSLGESTRREAGLANIAFEWVPVNAADRDRVLQEHRVDVLCGAETVTLARRAVASFSLPIFAGGVGVLVRSDAPARLREILAGRGQNYHPVWRASATQVLQSRAFTAVQGTTADTWLTGRIRDLEVMAGIFRVNSYDAGVQALVERNADAFFGERAVLLEASRRHTAARELMVLDRQFTFEPIALAFARGDEEFRLVVDRTLSGFYRSGKLASLYTKWFGEPDDTTLTFFRWNTLSD
jgi:ABC-type amino acid transport substrate-binding protein